MTKEQVDLNPQPYTLIFSKRSKPCMEFLQQVNNSQIRSKFKLHCLDTMGLPNDPELGTLTSVPCVVLENKQKMYGFNNLAMWLESEGVMPVSLSDSYDNFANSYSFIENTFCPSGVGCSSFEYLSEGNIGNGMGVSGGMCQGEQQPPGNGNQQGGQGNGNQQGGQGGNNGNPRENARMSEMDKRMETMMSQRTMDVPSFNRQ
jgi:hypothetical protein